jgi:cytochrome P450
MKQLYGHGHNELKTTWYNIWIIKGLPTGFFAEQNKTIHSGLRKKVSTAYSMTAILRFEKYIQQCLDLMMQRLRVHAEGKRTVNMSEWTNALAFDVVGELAFGEPFGHLEAEEDVLGIRNLIYNGFWLSSILGHVWGQLNLIQNPVVESILALVGQKSPFGALMDWTNEKVMARRASGEKVQRHDMLSHFLAMKNADGTPVSHSDVLIESLNIV